VKLQALIYTVLIPFTAHLCITCKSI